jgi:hypothetical protein
MAEPGETIWRIVQFLAALVAGFYFGWWECSDLYAAGYEDGIKATMEAIKKKG